jgi:hypothetical protein
MFTIWQLNRRSLCISETGISTAISCLDLDASDGVLEALCSGDAIEMETLTLCSNLSTLVKLQTAQISAFRSIGRLA